jgi:hypothetical protein
LANAVLEAFATNTLPCARLDPGRKEQRAVNRRSRSPGRRQHDQRRQLAADERLATGLRKRGYAIERERSEKGGSV